MNFYHPLAFWLGCLGITLGVLSHIPMFIHSADMGYHMAGMLMSTTMIVGMLLIPLGLLLSAYGTLPRLSAISEHIDTPLQFHVADNVPLNNEHYKLVLVLMVAVTIDVMKPATLGFVMPGMAREYQLSSQTVGVLAAVALVGTTIGSILWGITADTFGRRAAILLSALMFIGTSICGAMPSFAWNLAMCFLMGLSAGGLLPITFTLMAESIPANHRGWLLVSLGGLGTIAGYLVAAGSAAWLEPLFSWRILWMLGLPTGLAVIFLNRYIPESPRYLAAKGFNHEARNVLARFSRDPQKPTPVVVENTGQQASGSLHELFRAPYLGITLGLIVVGTAWGLVNFGFLLWLPTNLYSLGLDEYANGLIAQSALFALPGVAVVIWLYHHWNSIYTLILFTALTAIALGLFALCSALELLTRPVLTLCTSVLLVSVSGVIAMLIPYASEIYPVSLRGTGSGIVAASSKLGGIIGTGLGIAGLLDHLAWSALVISLPLIIAIALLLKSGVDTRGLRLEDIRQAIQSKSQ